ncbi:MAG: 3'-5' exonuclease [Holophagaceae bacterium]|nr:3'-5' exonuclease [Holophagaceae bacterium]
MGLMAWGREKLGAGPPGGDLAVAELRFTVLDTELTGLDTRRDDIIAIGALHMQGGRIELGGAFQELVKPTARLDGRTVVIHGITPSELEARPAISEVLAAFLDYAAGTVLVGHCLALDLAFLNRDAKRSGRPPFRNAAVDTLSLFGWLRRRAMDHPAFTLERPAPSLYDLADAFEVPVEAAHSAIGDAYITAQVFQRFLPFLRQAGVESLAGLRRVGDPRRQLANLADQEGHTHF